MEIRIGIVNTPRELNFESSLSVAEVEKTVTTALEAGAKVLRLRDEKGKIYIVPTETIAFVEVGSEESRRVGFVAEPLPHGHVVELLFVTLGGILLGLAARYGLPHRHLHGSVLIPALGGVVAAVVWVALTWAGLPWDGGLIWILALGLAAAAALLADVALGRSRTRRDDAALEAMLAGRVAPDRVAP